MLAADEEFAGTCQWFADLWPIFRAEEQRRRDIQVGRPRAAIVEDSLDARIRHRPNCYGSHDGNVPLDWPHTLHALYQVRCNLFHGEKGVESESDWMIVEAGVHVLSRFMSGSGYLV
jgi:hypothetical protein